jgi:hypothetical protein
MDAKLENEKWFFQETHHGANSDGKTADEKDSLSR